MKYKLAIFDFDGTLANTFPFVLSIADMLAERHKLPKINKNEIHLLRGYHAASLIKMHKIPMRKVPVLARDVQQLMHENIHEIRLFQGIADVIRYLAASQVQIAIVTSNAKRNVEKVLGEELMSLVSCFEGGVSMFKKSAKLRKILRKCAVKPMETLSIGDEIRDIEAARNAGIPCAAVTWGYATTSALNDSSPDYMVSEAGQIVELFA